MNPEIDRVRRYFERTAERFDSIYTGRKSAFSRKLDQWLRWDMQERMKLTLQACRPIEGKTVLDAGCGTGRFCFPLAQSGAGRVVGVDFAPSMIERARVTASELKLEDCCEFICADLMQLSIEETFDYVIAVGLFDYIREDRHLLIKLRRLTRGKAVMTFPRADTWRVPVRRLRLALLGCPVFFYNEKRIRDHLIIAGFIPQRVLRVGKLYFVEAI
jgi:magnesium protoporphyrin O-methyltransferase